MFRDYLLIEREEIEKKYKYISPGNKYIHISIDIGIGMGMGMGIDIDIDIGSIESRAVPFLFL